MDELNLRGISWELGGLYSCSHAEARRHERSLKNMHNARQYCQLCHPKDQHRKPGLTIENIYNVPFSRQSIDYHRDHIDIATTSELTEANEAEGMEFILSLMRRDKDALGFVPVGGTKGIHALVVKRQILIAHQNGDPCGYSFYTMNPSETHVNIHQACTADDARLMGHGTHLVEQIAIKHPEAIIVAKVRDDLAANHFWHAIGFEIDHTKTHKTSGSTIHHYHRKAKQSHE